MNVQELQEKLRKAGVLIPPVPEQAPWSISLQGLEGTGKTTFILATMPLPIVLVNLGDRDPRIVLYNVDKSRLPEITLYNLQPTSPGGWTYEEAKQALGTLAEIAKAHLPEIASKHGTFAIDSGSRFWSQIQKVYVEPKEQERIRQGLKSLGGLIYEDANLVFEGFVTYAKAFPVYLALTHTMRQDWDAEGPIPNSFSPRQQRQVPYLMEVVLELRKICAQCNAPSCDRHQGRVHVGKLIKFARNTSLEGLELRDPTFAKLDALFRGGS